MSDKATSKVFDRTDILTKLDAAEKALTEMTTLRDIALRDFVIATDKWERAEVQVIDLKAALRKATERIEKLRTKIHHSPTHLERGQMLAHISEALTADDAASK